MLLDLFTMSGQLRSKQGCWTCRLRKKKCDEGRPHCSTCESLSITCYGFGPKPDWMDAGEKERAMAVSLKQIVKSTSRRKVATQPKYQGDTVMIAPKTLIDSAGTSSSTFTSLQQPERYSTQESRKLRNESAVSILVSKKIMI